MIMYFYKIILMAVRYSEQRVSQSIKDNDSFIKLIRSKS